jgi:hypothetical protein
MTRLSDYAHDAPWYARKATVPLRNGLYRATRPLRTVSGRVGNWRRRRFAETGKGFWAERATRGLRSSLPGYRDRINPATGRPRRDDATVYARRDEQLARMRKAQAFTPGTEAWEHGPDAYRALPAQPREQAQERNERLTRQHNERCGMARSR